MEDKIQKDKEQVKKNAEVLFRLLQCALLGKENSWNDLQNTNVDWDVVFKLSLEQGIPAFAYDGLNQLMKWNMLGPTQQLSKPLKLQWGFAAIQVEKNFQKQWNVIAEVGQALSEQHLKTVVLKGLSVAQCYPKPNHRSCGDFDCFLLEGKYEQGNQIAEGLGAEVDRDDYKHSHIYYKDLVIENHQFCTPILGSRRAKELEKILQRLLKEEELPAIQGLPLYSPGAMFNALFLSVHAWSHLLGEGLVLRQLCDWAMFLDKNAAQVDWASFRKIISARGKGVLRFAESMTRLAIHYLGISVPSTFLSEVELRKEDFVLLNTILFDQEEAPSAQDGVWNKRKALVVNAWVSAWRYRAFSGYTAFFYVLNNAVAHVFHHTPKLNS